MKNVLIVMSSLANGGAERSLVNFLNEADCTNKYRVDLLLFKRAGSAASFCHSFRTRCACWSRILP